MKIQNRAMRFDIITIFSELFRGVFEFGIIRRAVEAGLIEINLHDLRDYTFDRHHQVDDRPFGGGAGMVMKPEPLFRAIEAVTHKAEDATIVMLSPQGRLFTQRVAEELARRKQVVLICGRYEGVDERVIEQLADDEFYEYELIGAAVVTAEGRAVGRVVRLLGTSSADLLVVEADDKRELLIPFVDEICTEVDVGARRITINPPEGLLDL